MRFLVVEDDPKLAEFIAAVIRAQGWAVDLTSRVREADGMAREYPYNALVVDVNLPEGPEAGFEFVARLREEKIRTPVLFLTARGALEDRIRGLDLGGDDYLVKPAHVAELRARLNALVRRDQPGRTHSFERFGLRIDFNERVVTLDGSLVYLTGKEYALLEVLASNPGRLFTREEIVDRVWNADFGGEMKVIDVYVGILRKKLGRWVIETVRGIGYRFPLVPDEGVVEAR
jgi:two-component system response regulator PhoP